MVRRVKVWKILELLLKCEDFLLRRVALFAMGHFGDVGLRLGAPLVAVSQTGKPERRPGLLVLVEADNWQVYYCRWRTWHRGIAAVTAGGTLEALSGRGTPQKV